MQNLKISIPLGCVISGYTGYTWHLCGEQGTKSIHQRPYLRFDEVLKVSAGATIDPNKAFDPVDQVIIKSISGQASGA